MDRNTFIDIMAIEEAASIAVATTGTAWSKSFKMPKNRSFALELKVESPGTVTVAVWFEQGNEELTAVEESLTNANFVIPENDSALFSPASAKVYMVDLGPVVSKFARLKFIGSGSNDAGTKITRARLVLSENA